MKSIRSQYRKHKSFLSAERIAEPLPTEQLLERYPDHKDLIEEMADVLMYYNDVMLCYGITPEELQAAYEEKFQKNMTRW